MGDFKDALMFREGFFFGITFWILFIILGFLLVLIIYIPIEAAVDQYKMEKHHCVRTDEIRANTRTEAILVGKVIIPTVKTIIENRYQCDDQDRWR